MPRSSPLHAVHLEAGATMTPFAGWTMPVRYGSDLGEHHAVRQRAGMFDLSHMGEIEVRGADAPAALDHALVGELSRVTVGRARYSLVCARDGGIIDDLVVYRLTDDRYLLVVNAVNAAAVHEELKERCAEHDVTVDDAGERTALVAVQGPAAVEVLAGVTGADLESLRYYAAVEALVADVPVLLARTGYTGEDGFELFCSADDAIRLWRALAEVGAAVGLQPCGLASRDTLRLEAGMPLYGNELSRERSPYEAGLGRVVKLDKAGDFVGREALRRQASSPPAQTLVGLIGEGRRAPRHGYGILAGDRVVGEVTSGALSPTLGVPIAMAYVSAERAEPGTELTVDVRGAPVAVRVTDLPFYRRP